MSDPIPPSAPQPPSVRPTMMPRPAPRPAWQVAVGLLLVLPALVLLVAVYVEPAVWIVRSSFTKVSVLRISSVDGFTTDNYQKVFDRGLTGDFGFALSLALVPLVLVLVGAPLLAWAAHLGGTPARWLIRVLLALPLAAYAPVAIAVALLVDRADDFTTADLALRGYYWWGTLGLVAALAATLYLATLRRRDPRRQPWAALAVTAGVAVAAVIAGVLQEFTYPYVFGAGTRRVATPVVLMFEQSFVYFDFGGGAAVATLLLAVLFLLGLAVTFVAIVSGLRLEFDASYRSAGQPSGWPAARIVGAVTAVVVAVALLSISLYGLAPLLGHLFGGADGPPLPAATATIAANTWLPPLLSTIVGVTAATLAAFGIGALRPLGRHSEWLLVPFGLFLFVGVGPLALRAYAAGQVSGRLNSFLALVPPSLLAIPALFVLALFFRGQALRGEALRQEGSQVSAIRLMLPTLPTIPLVFLVTWVVQAQDLLWPVVSAPSQRHLTAPVALTQTIRTHATRHDAMPFDLVLPVGLLVVLFLLVVAAQVGYLDRIALRVGQPERAQPPRT